MRLALSYLTVNQHNHRADGKAHNAAHRRICDPG
jgi:hypothetical protein